MSVGTVETLAAGFRPGQSVFLPGSCGEARVFTDALVADPQRTRGLHLVTSFVPGINPLPIDRMADNVRVSSLFLQPGLSGALSAGRIEHLPISYAGFVRDLRRRAFDSVVVHVAPPDAHGRCSLGAAAEFSLLAAARSARLLAVVNYAMPAPVLSPSLPYSGFAEICEVDCPLPAYNPGAPDAAMIEIARIISAWVPDGAVLQLGLGKAPSALATALSGHRRLRFWSGLLSDWFVDLAEAGALAEGEEQVCCAAVGTPDFYGALAGLPGLRIAGCDHTHDAARLAGQAPLIAVNGALEVDLYGQCNLELAAGELISGPGGAPDFARAAARGEGLSIVALPATAGRSARSRIVARLDGGLVTLGRQDVDLLVTEHGAADLRGLSASARARALIAIAAPEAREALAEAWFSTAAR